MRDLNNLNREHDEKRTKRISDAEIYATIEKVKVDAEDSLKDALVTILATVVDLRAFVRKLYKEIVPAKERKNYEEKK